ncbi:MAG: hypothetical protein K8S25_00905 [Alphaproteobacteria bacterium]|nr:hypothetical protein [Alphaproteobacteria bacterium]
MERTRSVLEATAIAGIFLEGAIAALILLTVRAFDAGLVLGTCCMAAVGVLLGLIERADRGLAAATIMMGTIVLVVAVSAVAFVVEGAEKSIIVAGLGVVFVCAAEFTRSILLFVSIGGMK